MASLNVTGSLRVPGDKSISHRALILSALATGPSKIRGLLQSADLKSTHGVLQSLGVEIPYVGAAFVIRGVGRQGLRRPPGTLDCGNSGTTCRLMAGVIAGQEFSATFVGDNSLSRRPMKRLGAAP